MSASELPAGWEAVVSKSTGDTFYKDTLTGETTWDRPTEAAPAHSQHDAKPSSAAAGESAVNRSSTPARAGREAAAAPAPTPAPTPAPIPVR